MVCVAVMLGVRRALLRRGPGWVAILAGLAVAAAVVLPAVYLLVWSGLPVIEQSDSFLGMLIGALAASLLKGRLGGGSKQGSAEG